MRITANSVGGFSGVAEHYEVDTAALRNGEMVEELLRNLDFLAGTPTQGADLTRWEILLDDGKQQRSIAFTEDGSAESAPLQALIAELRATQ